MYIHYTSYLPTYTYQYHTMKSKYVGRQLLIFSSGLRLKVKKSKNEKCVDTNKTCLLICWALLPGGLAQTIKHKIALIVLPAQSYVCYMIFGLNLPMLRNLWYNSWNCGVRDASFIRISDILTQSFIIRLTVNRYTINDIELGIFLIFRLSQLPVWELAVPKPE